MDAGMSPNIGAMLSLQQHGGGGDGGGASGGGMMDGSIYEFHGVMSGSISQAGDIFKDAAIAKYCSLGFTTLPGAGDFFNKLLPFEALGGYITGSLLPPITPVMDLAQQGIMKLGGGQGR